MRKIEKNYSPVFVVMTTEGSSQAYLTSSLCRQESYSSSRNESALERQPECEMS